MIAEIQALLEQYQLWLRDRSTLHELANDTVQVTTPFLDRHNDHIQFYVRRTPSGFTLTDGGETLSDLRESGCELDTPKRRLLLDTTLNGFGVQRAGDELLIHATPQSFAPKKHSLLQAIIGVNDLFVLAVPWVASVFLEDVEQWLRSHDIRFTPSIKFSGKSGYEHHFDFVVPASSKAPERLVRAVARPTRDIAESLVFAWLDTRDVRPERSQFYAIINDEERAPARTVVDALRSYEIAPVLWSRREEAAERLAA